MFHATEVMQLPAKWADARCEAVSTRERRATATHVVSCRLSSEAGSPRALQSPACSIGRVSSNSSRPRSIPCATGLTATTRFVRRRASSGSPTKWNNNGERRGGASALAQLSVSQGIVEEGDEDVDRSASGRDVESSRRAGGAVHFSYSVSQGRLLCDIQGVWNARGSTHGRRLAALEAQQFTDKVGRRMGAAPRVARLCRSSV